MITTNSGLQYEDIKLVGGQIVKAGQVIRINYKVALSLDNLINSIQLLDSSENHKDPVVVTVGNGELLKGLDEGVIGMGRGDTRLLILSPNLAFNKRGIPGIVPQNANLFIEINISTKI